MGEYAIRKSDGARVKIGTCEDMYYLRFDQRHLVKHEPGNVNPACDEDAAQLRFRLPFADEDDVQPGEFKDYNRFELLYRKSEVQGASSWFSDPATAERPGLIQLHHDCGLLINVPCYHGEKLPTITGLQTFWNGRSGSFLVLSSLRAALKDGELRLFPVLRCQFCNEAWRYEWADIWEYVPFEARIRLREYAGTAVAA